MAKERVCPWYLGYFLANPLRRVVQNPEKILRPYVNEGMTVLDIGSAMGFFTLPLCKLVGESGHVIAVDLQARMISSLKRRVKRRGLSARVETRICSSTSLGIDDLTEKVDVALAFAVLHEIPLQENAIKEIAGTLKNGGKFIMAEPKGHVTKEGFHQTMLVAERLGLKRVESPLVWHSEAVVMRKFLSSDI